MPSPIQLAALHLAIPAAQAAMWKWRVPASVTLGQWIPESSWGQSKLALQAKNFFGVKYSHLRGDEHYMELLTPEFLGGKREMIEQQFKLYGDAEASFDDHARLLATAPRYAGAMVHVADPFQFAVLIGQEGYSTTPGYGTQIGGFIRQYNLTQYDVPPPAASAAKEVAG